MAIMVDGCRKGRHHVRHQQITQLLAAYTALRPLLHLALCCVPLALFLFFLFPICLLNTTERRSVDDNACQRMRNLSQCMTQNRERVTDLTRMATKTKTILNNGNVNTEGLRVNTKQHRIRGHQSTGGYTNTD